MVSKFTPSRAEVVDISNAIITGIDGFILSPETAVSSFEKKHQVNFHSNDIFNVLVHHKKV